MMFDKEYLTRLAKGKVMGDFYPFNTGSKEKTEKYIKDIVGRLKHILTISLEADFKHYGSGYASYVPMQLAKQDKSGSHITAQGNRQTEETEGLMLYLCRLAPYAVYAVGRWSITYKNGREVGGAGHFIEPVFIGSLPAGDWQFELQQLKDILHEYGYIALTSQETNIPLDFPLHVPTILADPPYRVFDCLFYWAD